MACLKIRGEGHLKTTNAKNLPQKMIQTNTSLRIEFLKKN